MTFNNCAFLTVDNKPIRFSGLWVEQDDSDEPEDARGRRHSADYKELKKKCKDLNQIDEWNDRKPRHAVVIPKSQAEYERLYSQYVNQFSEALNGCGDK